MVTGKVQSRPKPSLLSLNGEGPARLDEELGRGRDVPFLVTIRKNLTGEARLRFGKQFESRQLEQVAAHNDQIFLYSHHVPGMMQKLFFYIILFNTQ